MWSISLVDRTSAAGSSTRKVNFSSTMASVSVKRHGREYRLDRPGKLLSATAYRNGLGHGVARQWSDDGRLIGTYRMKNGTGVDLWWQEGLRRSRRPYLAEVHFMLKGHRHGFEWWLNEDQRSVYQERHWSLDDAHGV